MVTNLKSGLLRYMKIYFHRKGKVRYLHTIIERRTRSWVKALHGQGERLVPYHNLTT
jgi:hypothetical protein